MEHARSRHLSLELKKEEEIIETSLYQEAASDKAPGGVTSTACDD